jgi:amidohydrolase
MHPSEDWASMTDRMDRLRDLAAAAAPAAIELRRRLHRRPELGRREFETTRAVADALTAVGVTPALRPEATGLTAELGNGGPTVAFRADVDALPIQEQTGLDYASEVPGVMHACGHDAHTAIGYGIAAVLSQLDSLPGRVRFVFQPAEELIPGGAVDVIADGLLDDVTAIAAFHVDPALAPGKIGLRAGPITGASDRLVIRLNGPGGHTSRPHRTVDLIYAAARVAAELPTLLQRTTDPRHPVILAFGRISGGNAENVIPGEVEMGGTVRLFDIDLWRTMQGRVSRLVRDLADPLGAVAKVEYEQGSPPVLNDTAVIQAVARAGEAALGADNLADTHQSMGSEDFSWYLEHTPGALVRLGSSLTGRDVDLHSSTFDVDERAIETGILAGSAALLELLGPA